MALIALPRVHAVDLSLTVKGTDDVLRAAVRQNDSEMVQLAVHKGADPFEKDVNGRSALDIAPNDSMRALLHQLSSAANDSRAVNPAHSPSYRGFLSKWTNMVGGFKLRWFVLKDGVLSYYQSPEDVGRHARGSVYLRYATIQQDKREPNRFEVVSQMGKGVNKFYLRGTDAAECTQWIQVLERSKRFHELEAQHTTGAERSSTATEPASAGTALQTHESGFLDDASSEAASLEDSASVQQESTGLPHSKEFAIVQNLMTTYFEVSLQAVHKLDGTGHAASAIQAPLPTNQGEAAKPVAQALGASTDNNETLETLKVLMHKRYRLWQEYCRMVAAREAYLKQQIEREVAARQLWEENISTLAHQQNDLENSLRNAARVISQQRRELGAGDEAVPAGGQPVRSLSLDDPNDEFFDTVETEGDEREAPSGKEAGAAAGAAAGGAAAGAGAGAAAGAGGAEEAAQPEPAGKEEKEQAPPGKQEGAPAAGREVQPLFKDGTEEKKSFESYTHLRERMPISNDDRPSMSLWGILKNNIGKDLTKISFPVSFNEPTSMLQRMAEDMEFTECLDAAGMQTDPIRRLMYVAAFAMSNYSSTIGRIAKPFNPLLGETFEYASLDRQYRYVSEQVSHHPPVSACFAEAPTWEYMGCVDAKSKFLGRSFEIRPTGVAHVRLKVSPEWLPSNKRDSAPRVPGEEGLVAEHYSWNKVTTSVSGFITGSPTMDHFGEMKVVNHVTGDTCVLNFVPRGWNSANAREIRGQAFDSSGTAVYDIAGRWSTQLVARRCGTDKTPLKADVPLDKNDTPIASGQSSDPLIVLWRNSEKPRTPFALTPFAITLNSCPDGLRVWLPPTDCRLRPDLVAFETGRFDDADRLKAALEQHQRETRKKREQGELPAYHPVWFQLTNDKDSNAPFWQPRMVDDAQAGHPIMKYWKERTEVGEKRLQGDSSATWPDAPDIFGDLIKK